MSIKQQSFKDIFFSENPKALCVPDYQRAFAWEKKQIEQFIQDLQDYRDGKYYFGHFIIEEAENTWYIVDGQQRITTFCLFLIYCEYRQALEGSESEFLNRFSTVSYDKLAWDCLRDAERLSDFLELETEKKKEPREDQVLDRMGFETESFTQSQYKMALSLWHFHEAFETSTNKNKQPSLYLSDLNKYKQVILQADASLHLVHDKAVAVNVFEMHNTRGIRLSLMEKVKAKLMKAIYSLNEDNKDEQVERLQEVFGKIYSLESKLSENAFVGTTSLDQLFLSHLRVVNAGEKEFENDFSSPERAADDDNVLKYLDDQMAKKDDVTDYVHQLIEKFHDSVDFMCHTLPKWAESDPVARDIIVLDKKLSTEFLLLLSKKLQSIDWPVQDVPSDILKSWEDLVFLRDFHDKYFSLKIKDNFQQLFEDVLKKDTIKGINEAIQVFVKDSFRKDRISGNSGKLLKEVVAEYVGSHKAEILKRGRHFWSAKMKYVLYKYECQHCPEEMHKLMKEPTTIEHILPGNREKAKQTLQEKDGWDEQTWKILQSEEINPIIDGIGNLLLLSSSENSSLGNKRPDLKEYKIGLEDKNGNSSYAKHNREREVWKDPDQWEGRIMERGERIFKFLMEEMIGIPESEVHV